MARPVQPKHYIVDGSNIATEGRSLPSLEQLNEAVLAFMEDFPGALITVVVDATFGHRINAKEVKAFDEAVANNELVAPPAGAIGRGDAFVLTIANKAQAGILSNDSFQEFHGEYPWLFDEGRLIGGKPVPNVGWVFVPRSPVRGPKSRRSVREAQGDPQAEKYRTATRVRRKAGTDDEPVAAPPADPAAEPVAPVATPAVLRERAAAIVAAGGPAATDYVNELGAYLEFAERHPVGSTVEAVVDKYSSHGAYTVVDGVSVYVPLRLMDDPPPSGARKAMQIGTAQQLVIVAYVPERRSIDAARPHVADKALPEGTAIVPLGAEPPKKKTRARKAAPAPSAEPTATEAPDEAPAAEPPAPKPARKRTAKKTVAPTPPEVPAAAEPAEPPPPEPARKRAAAKKAAASPQPARKRAAKKAAASPEPPPPAESPAPKPARKRAAKKAAPAPEPTGAPAAEPADPAPRRPRARKKQAAG